MVEPHIAGQAGGEAPSGDLDAIRMLCDGQGGLPPMPIMGCLLPASSGCAGVLASAALAAEAEASGTLPSKVAAEGTLLMLLGVLGSDCPCNHKHQ